MSPIVEIVKYVLLGIVFIVIAGKAYQLTMNIIKKYKKDDLDFEENL